jgi:hypothetical protein
MVLIDYSHVPEDTPLDDHGGKLNYFAVVNRLIDELYAQGTKIESRETKTANVLDYIETLNHLRKATEDIIILKKYLCVRGPDIKR